MNHHKSKLARIVKLGLVSSTLLLAAALGWADDPSATDDIPPPPPTPLQDTSSPEAASPEIASPDNKVTPTPEAAAVTPSEIISTNPSEIALPSASPSPASPSSPSLSSPSPSSPSPSPAPSPGEDKLPNIQAKSFPVSFIKRSASTRVYSLKDPESRQPAVGHLILLKLGDEPIMAYRVLRTYPDENRIAAKRIKTYGDHDHLEKEIQYLAIEKISDVNPPNTSQDKKDLKELETLPPNPSAKAYDPELDASTTPHSPNPDEESAQEPIAEDDADQESITVEETTIIDHNSHWFTLGFGYVRNNSPPTQGGSSLFSAGNIRYGYNIGKLIFFDRAHLQDSFTLEAGTYLYKTINFEIEGDSYFILALNAALRYNLLFSEHLGLFLYAGIMQNLVIASTQGQSDGTSQLNSVLPTLGGGLLFQIGPSWYTRVDIGLDSITLNLVLRF